MFFPGFDISKITWTGWAGVKKINVWIKYENNLYPLQRLLKLCKKLNDTNPVDQFSKSLSVSHFLFLQFAGFVNVSFQLVMTQKCYLIFTGRANGSAIVIKTSTSFLLLDSPWWKVREVKGQPGSKLGVSLGRWSAISFSGRSAKYFCILALRLSFLFSSYARFCKVRHKNWLFFLQAGVRSEAVRHNSL